MRDEVKKNHKNEKSFLGSILAFLDFRKFFKNPLFIYGAIIFVIIAGLIFIFASLFLPARTIDESLIIKNIKIKQVATIIIGQPIKWTVLVKRSDINSGQYLVKLPKKADNIKISLIKGEQAEKILSAGLEKTPFSDRQKQSALNDKKGNLLFRFANFLFADLEQAASDAVQNALEAITQPENPDIIKTSDSTIVDLSQQAMSEAEQPAASINSGQAKQEEKKAEKEQAKEQEEQQVAPATPDSPVIPASAGIQGEGADTNTNLDSPVPLSVENSDVAKQGNNNTSPAPEETPAEYVQISYETPSPEIIEQETNTGKLVTISSSDTGIINCETLNPRTAGGATSNDGATSLLQSAGASISGAFLNILSAIKKYLFADLEQAVNEIINFQLPIFNELSNDSISKDTETPTTEIIVPTLEEPAETPAPVEEQLVIEAPAETPTEITMPVEETPAPAETPEPVEVRLPQVESVTAADAAYQECLAQQVPLTDVLAFTNIPEIYKVGQEDKIKIKWKSNGNQNMDFHAYDLNNNGKLDYVEWIVPHLSDQVFDIIYISKAFRLDENKQIAEDIYDTVATQDNQWATVQSNEWLRFTFESLVDSTKNIDIYAKPTSEVGLAYLEVYRENGDQVIATLYIDHEDYYHVSTANLGDNPTDVFDFKIIGGVDIDYVQDAACTAGKSGNWNDSTVWTCAKIPDSSDTVTISNASYTVTVTADAAASTLSISAGTLNIQTFAVAVTGAVQITGTGTISGSTGVLTGGSYDVQSGTISAILGGTGIALTKTTSGTVVLSGANTFTGGVTLSAGTLDLRAATALGTGTLTINGGSFKKSTFGTLTLTTNNVQAWNGDFSIADSSYTIDFGTGAITLSANRAITVNSGNMIFGGAIGDGGNAYTITLTGAGSIAFTGANTYDGLTTVSSGGLILSGDNSAASGGVTLTAGTLDLRSATALGTGTLTITGGSLKKATIGVLTLTTNNPMSWNGDFSMAASSYGIDFGTGAITLGGNRTITASSSGFIFGGAIGDGGNGYTLTKAGHRNLILNGANTYTGLTTVSAGVLTLAGDNSAASGGVTLNSGATLNINSATALGTGTFTINGGTISNTSGGTITNTENNIQAWNGDFTLYQGTALNLGTGAVTLSGNRQVTTSSFYSTLTIGGAIGDNGNSYTLTFTTVGYGGVVVLSGNNTYTGLTTVTPVSTFSLTLSGDNTAASGGVTLNAGGLYINSATALGTGTLTINGGGIGSSNSTTITTNNIQNWNGNFTCSNSTVGLGTGAVTLGGNIQITMVWGTLTVGGAIGDSGSGYTLTLAGNNSTLILSGANTYTGATTITGTTSTNFLRLSNALAAQYSTVTVSVANGLKFGTSIGTFTIGGLSGASNFVLADTGSTAITLQAGGNNANTTYSGIMSGTSGALTKQGSGTLILSGVNTYTGDTIISAGTLQNGVADSFKSATTTISSGATLDLSTFNLTLAGSTSFANNGTLKLYGDQTVTNAPTNGVGSTVEYNATAGSRAIKSWTYTNAILKINGTGGTFTLPADPACTGITLAAGTLAGSTQAITTGGFTMSGGTFTGSGAMAVNGNLTYSSGTNSHTGAWTQGTGNLGWNTSATYIQNYQAASGAIITLSTRAVAKSITVPTDATVNLGSNYFQSWNASNDQLSLQGTWSATTGYVLVSAFSSRSNSNPIQVGTVELRMQSSDDVWTQSGSIQCGTLRILGDSGTNKATLTLAGNMNAGAVVIGHTIGVAIYSTSGVLNLGSGTHTIASIVQGNAANLNDAIDFGTSNTSITGSANFTGIAVSNTSATVNFTGTTGTPTLTTAGATMPNMVVNNNGVTSFTVADTPLTTGSFTLTAGKFTAPATMTASSVLLTAGTFTAGANLNNSGNWTNNGATFTNSSGTVTLTGATPTIGGTSANTFYNLTAITADQVIVFPQASTTTISGTLKLEGASGHNILLKSDEAGSDGSKAHRARVDIAAVLDNHSNGYFQYVTPYDNDASNGAAQPIQQQNCVDGGNNLGWLFNVLPVASSVLIDGVATDVILTEGTTHNVVCAGTVTDLNGYADITSVTAKLYRSGVGAGAGDNNANHYTLTGDSNCIPSGGSENTETYTCTFPVYFYADPTDDTSSYPTENWVCQMTPTDTVGAGTADTDTIEMDSLTAHDVTTSIVYGSLALGADTGTSDTTTTITNTGNRSIDIQVGGYGSVSDDGKALVCAIGSVTVTNERYSTTEGVSYTSKTTLPSDASPNTVTVDIPQGVSSTGVIYWGMGLPSSGVGSSCAGKVVFTAVNH